LAVETPALAPVARTDLPNGLRVLTVPGGRGSMTVMLFVTAGSRYETADTAGVAHMLEHLFWSGTGQRPSARAISGEIDSLGCKFNAQTDKEWTNYYIQGAEEYTANAVTIIADLIKNAIMPAPEVERERRVVLAELRAAEDNPRSRVRTLIDSAIYGDTPMGWYTGGSPDVILALQRAQIMEFRARLYGAGRLILVVAGNPDHDQHVRLASESLGDMPSGGSAWKPVPAVRTRPVNLVAHRDIRLCNLCIAFPGPSYLNSDREMLAARMMNSILGVSMSSRLMSSIRERQGLCYSIQSFLDPFTETGSLIAFASTDPRNAGQVVSSIMDELGELADQGPTSWEVRKAMAMTKGTFVLEREDSASLARLSGFELMHRGNVAARGEKFEIIESISAEEITAAARRYLPSSDVRLAVVGPRGSEDFIAGSGRDFAAHWEVVHDRDNAP
jgi:predicted Zn-dependent peptidase